MKAQSLHNWQVTPKQAVLIQQAMADRVSKEEYPGIVQFIAGVDISVSKSDNMARGAVVVLSYPELKVVESRIAERAIEFPYVPGLLSFREAPVLLAACEKLSHNPDVIFVDGQGLAHPRRLGLASHLGVLWDKPTIGCAKSRLCGTHEPVGSEAGSIADLIDGGQTIGAVLRTRANTKPLYISVGHRISLEAAIQMVLKCCKGYRLPEPTRLAHLAAGGNQLQSNERSYP
ncbi:MAG: deoxyribonuclease V [Dehalococcoidia bacterium]|nr:deoxyribonuclease V [Dehalococcoidia bacterium]